MDDTTQRPERAPLTDRQRYWLAASDRDAAGGNDLAAGFFALLALPNDHERADQRRTDDR